MKLTNFHAGAGEVHLGVVEDKRVLDLTRVLPNDSGFSSVVRWVRAGDASLQRTREQLAVKRNEPSAWLDLPSIRYAPLVDRDSRMFCVGLNYADHAAENRVPPPDSPIFFAKLASVAIGHEQPIPLPEASKQVDYEAEFAFIVGRKAFRVTPEEALRSIAGYTILNDVTARDLQFHDKQWFRGKNCDGLRAPRSLAGHP